MDPVSSQSVSLTNSSSEPKVSKEVLSLINTINGIFSRIVATILQFIDWITTSSADLRRLEIKLIIDSHSQSATTPNPHDTVPVTKGRSFDPSKVNGQGEAIISHNGGPVQGNFLVISPRK
jgi:hypothetical protein